jgi:hypothetical protein
MSRVPRRLVWVLAVLLGAATLSWSQLGTSYADRILDLSESPGAFDSDNLISNEASFLDVIPALAEDGVTGGAYVGVGPDQNFSYIARIRPSVAYIIDIRRDNLLLHLLFKALFEAAPTRVEYLSLLIGRVPPEPTPYWQEASAEEILDAIDAAEPADRARLRQQLEPRLRAFGVPLAAADLETIARFHSAFVRSGFELRFSSHGRPPRRDYPTLRELLLATDRDGNAWSYVASEDAYRFVRDLEARDGIIPVVGDVSGPHAMRAIGAAMARQGVSLSAMYISNVENYLFRSGTFGRFVDNVARLPRAPGAVVIRSVFRGRSSVSLVQRVDDLAAGVATGRVQRYGDLAIAGAQR